LRIPQGHAVKHGPHHHRAEETLRRRSTQGTGMATPVETEATETEAVEEQEVAEEAVAEEAVAEEAVAEEAVEELEVTMELEAMAVAVEVLSRK